MNRFYQSHQKMKYLQLHCPLVGIRHRALMGFMQNSVTPIGCLLAQMWLAVRAYFERGEQELGANEADIIQIPTHEGARELEEFRPISLCNVRYKII